MADTVEIARKLKRNQTDAEKKLWSRLRGQQLDVKFRRQHPIPPYIVDFFCEDANLIIELDGGQHTPEADAERTAVLERNGYRVLRFWNNDVLQNMEGVLQTILQLLGSGQGRLTQQQRGWKALSPSYGEGPEEGKKETGRRPDLISPHPNPLPAGEGKRIRIAKIATAHGVRGLVKLIVDTDDPAGIDGIPLYTGESGHETLTLRLKNPAGRAWIASVDGITDRTAAEALRHATLWIDRETLPETESHEYYAADLVGMAAHDPQGVLVGTVIAVNDFGASPLLEIKPQGKSSFYLPFTNECVPAVDVAGKKLTVSVPEGLL